MSRGHTHEPHRPYKPEIPTAATEPRGDTPPCPGACNTGWRRAFKAAQRETVAAQREERDPNPRITVLTVEARPSLAPSVFCAACSIHVLAAVGRLPELAAHLFDTVPAPGEHATRRRVWRDVVQLADDPDGGVHAVLDCGHACRSAYPLLRHVCVHCLQTADVGAGKLADGGPMERAGGKRIVSPSGSPAWDAIDEVVTLAGDLEDRLRAHLHHSPPVLAYWTGGTLHRTRVLTDSVRYLLAWGEAFLSAPFAEAEGLRVLRLVPRLERAAGRDELRHHLPAPCPSCDRRGLFRDDGAEAVYCEACNRRWPESEYRRMVLVLADGKKAPARARARRPLQRNGTEHLSGRA